MPFPATFIQLHYHNRPGGVTTVMRLYARAFARHAKSSSCRNIIICNACDKTIERDAEIVSIHACDYHQFLTKKSYAAQKDRLARILMRLVAHKNLPRPICVVGHNLCLGKNIALSSAFADAAKQLGKSAPGISFFSVVHDFAEEGRIDMMLDIARIAAWGFAVWQDLYPARSGVRFVAISPRNRDILKAGGANVSFLPNPLEPPQDAPRLLKHNRLLVERALKKLSKLDGTHFDVHKKSMLYPVRVISRKNILEAILLACLINDSNILLGGPGDSARDRKLYSWLKSLCRRLSLPVVFDIGRCLQRMPSRLRSEALLPMLYKYCDCAISTSIAEGFGYTLYEPWLYGRAVIGRRPAGTGSCNGLNIRHLYNRIAIPQSWISFSELADSYAAGYNAWLSSKKHCCPDALSLLKKELIKNECIDFGSIGSMQQLKLFNRIASNKAMMSEFRKLNRFLIQKQFKLFLHRPKPLIEQNRQAVLKHLSPISFDDWFQKCFSRPAPGSGQKSVRHAEIARFFRFPCGFRPLMTANIVVREKK